MRLSQDGQFSVVAGNLSSNVTSGDGGPASQATFVQPNRLAVGPDGAIYVADGAGFRVRRIGTDGIITTVAGTGVLNTTPHSGDGGPATAAQIYPFSIAVARDNTLYIGDHFGQGYYLASVRAVRNGTIETVAGTASSTPGPAGSPAKQIQLQVLSDLAVAPDGSLVVNDNLGGGLWNFKPPLPGFATTTSFQVSSVDGSEVYVFDESGRHLSTQDALTGATRYQFAYNSAGQLSTITDANNLVTKVVRDDSGTPVAIVAPNGQMTSLGLSPDGYLATIDEPGGAHREFTYDSGGLLKTYLHPNLATTSFAYDNMGRLQHEDMPDGGSWTLTRTGPTPQNPLAPVTVTTVSAEGRTWTCSDVTDDAGTETRNNSGPDGLQNTQSTTQAAVMTQSTPDGMSWTVTRAANPRAGMQAPLPATTVATTPGGKQMTTTMSRAVTFGTNGSLVSQVDTTTMNGKATTSTYNVAASTITNVSPKGRQTVSTLDAQGRVVQVQAGNLAPTAYAYDSRGRLSTVTVGTGTTARVTSFAYDSLDRLQTVTDPLLRTQSYAYDDANRVTTQTFTDASFVVFGYDADGNITSVTPPGRTAHAFGFTPNDLISSYTPPVLSTEVPTTYDYNHDKQPTFIHRPDGSQIAFTYDSAGRLWTTTYPSVNGNVVVTRTYDPTTGKLKTASTNDGQTVTYGYDGQLLTSRTWSGTVAGSVSRTYDNNFRVATELVNGANSVSLGYDDDGLLLSAGLLTVVRDPMNGTVSTATVGTVASTYQYTTFGELKDVSVTQASTPLFEENIPDNGVGRDSLGRIQQKTETIQGVSHTYNYSYDSAGRLWQVLQDGTLTATYTYDANGNRIGGPGLTTTPVYDAQDRLLSYGKWTYVYTANGELQSKTDTTSGQVTSYSYDGMGNLRHVGLPDGRAIDYVIDSLNRRVAKKMNGNVVRKWVYTDGLIPAAEFDSSGNLVSRFEGTDYLVQGTTTYRIVKDHLGSPRMIVNATSGVVAQRLDYDEWGNVTVSGTQPTGWQPFGFAGGIYDPDTGLVRFGARDYDSTTARWMDKDPLGLGGGLNTSAYLLGDPVNAIDPSGTTIEVVGNYGDYVKAVNYLQNDPGMAAIIASLENSWWTYTVVLNSNAVDSAQGFTINWDPHSALDVGCGMQTPALGLGHEMAHAAGPWYSVFEKIISDPQYDNAEEKRVITGPESQAAFNLGEGMRADHGGSPTTVSGPTEIE
jgi:RHS repeat-associated protein